MKNDFLKYQAQTSEHPMLLQVKKARGCYIYDEKDRKYLDFIAGVSANTLGHHPEPVIKAVKKQLDAYMHVMVYGEFIQEPQTDLCKLIAFHLPDSLNCVYLTNSGTEAAEGALKLAKRVTGRFEIIAAKNAYHGNTQGAMSVCGKEEQNSAFRPLIPGSKFIEFNNEQDLEKINCHTAAVILETIQGGAGFILPENDYLKKVNQRCKEVGALLILDEIQSGIGRTGTFFGFQQYGIEPDVIITGKGLGGGMPIGAFIASKERMNLLTCNPKLGHITTFGGHPVIAAAALSTLQTLFSSQLMSETRSKEKLFRKHLVHKHIREIRGKGLMLALIMKNPDVTNHLILTAIKKGLLLFWLLYEPKAVRITPPLTISEKQILSGCQIILDILDTYPEN
ncbi:aspartate aminotransferase family protein [Lutimonas zeaxanthinifaciens]|uniref:aspartate aminotransferase family protein n=1 Tax=Lutimonas zeaxanthinifaciens TaxID=3060215 RepID=UPI00265D4851|nr:aspartate aminotransferase family protein [Lutimonas sp. YSD2104]WKK64853.1 aspartate aminotransferase family protein [Lutimonas sp. YSD2104]